MWCTSELKQDVAFLAHARAAHCADGIPSKIFNPDMQNALVNSSVTFHL